MKNKNNESDSNNDDKNYDNRNKQEKNQQANKQSKQIKTDEKQKQQIIMHKFPHLFPSDLIKERKSRNLLQGRGTKGGSWPLPPLPP